MPASRKHAPISKRTSAIPGNRVPASRKNAPSSSIKPANSSHEWRSRPCASFRVDQLPPDVSTEHLWRWFSSEGTIVGIDIRENHPKPLHAIIRFQPPPRRMFWSAAVLVQHPNSQKYPSGLEVAVSLAADPPCSAKPRDYVPESSNDKLKLHLSSIGFGCLVRPSLMRVLKTVDHADTWLEIDRQGKRMNVFFPYQVMRSRNGKLYEADTRRYKIVLDMTVMKMISEPSPVAGLQHLVVPMPRPPEYFRKVDNILSTFERNPRKWYLEQNGWCRATEIVQDIKYPRVHPVALHDETMDDMSIDIGRWTTIRLSFSEDSEENSKSYQQLQKLWLDCNIKSSMNCEFDIKSDATSAWNFLDHPVAAKAGQPSLLLGLSATVHLDFRVRYQLEVCISRDILNEYTIGHDFLKRLASLSPLDAVRRLEYLADQGDKLFEPMKLFEMEDAECYIPNARIPYYCAYVRKASVTPTTIRFSSPTVETSNRILRKYSQLQDRFLRVQFLEESEFGSIGRNREQNDDVWSRVERTLFEGVRIGNRTYEYLAFGNSQLRLSSAYFFCPTDHVSCADIRAWMGQLDHIKVVAKHSARLGQCFSTTREIRGIPVPQVRRIRDIERNGFCFTDGVGLVSSFFAQAIVQDMALDVLSEPTAFQFRMGGSKGVLAVWPHVQWSEVYIRDSQEKFKSKSSSLEVIRCATRSTATLNRQTIVILESLGVPQAKFLQLLKDQIVSFERAAQDASMAVDLLTKFVDENQSSLVLAELIKAGFMKVGFEEPFVLNLLKLWISWSFRLLKEKARIHVPKSAFVLGCVDETGTLRGHCKEIEGSSVKDVQRLPQIFLQFTDPDRHGRKIVVQGVCIVGRNPSLHPGDIRVVQAVDNPKLRHLSDVVVFPSKGDRPVPDMLSGGDLDGDDFFVIWDAEIIPRQWNYPPMNYKGPKPHELDRNVVVDDMRTFFVNYMKNDVLPLIAHAHLAFADQLNDGPRSQECLRLADLHSQAVDYAKTGQPAEYNWELQPRRWPHFMEKPSSYRSRKALGVLYDEVVKHAIKFHPDWQHAFDKRVLEKFALGEEVIATAKAIKIQYDISVRRLLAHHNVETEFELYSGWAMSRPNVGSDYKTQEQLGQEFSALKDRFREQCYGEIDAGDAESLDRFVAAMYKVTAEEIRTVLRVEQDMDEGHVEPSIPEGAKTRMPLISFPWIFHWVMIRLAMGKKYKPGKCVLSAARRAPAVEHGLQSLAERPKGGPSPSNTTTEAGAAVDEMQRLAAPADTVRGAMAAGTENQAVERTEEAVQADDDGEEDIYSDDRLVGVLGEGRSGMDRLAALVDEG